MANKIALYPGSFDPATMGHLDLVERGLAIFDEIHIAVAHNSEKRGLFTIDERVALLSEIFQKNPRVQIVTFEGLLVDYMRAHGLKTLLRGLRAISDFDYEFQFANMNRHIHPQVDTVFLMTSQKYFYISSSVVKEVASYKGDVSAFVPPAVKRALHKKLGQE